MGEIDQQGLPGQRPLGGDIIHHARSLQQLDVGAKLIVAHFRPGRSGGWQACSRP